jgi:hypothetical protein
MSGRAPSAHFHKQSILCPRLQRKAQHIKTEKDESEIERVLPEYVDRVGSWHNVQDLSPLDFGQILSSRRCS